jgi:competence protein ComEC
MAAALFFGFGVFLFGWPAPTLAMLCGRACDASLALMEGCLAGSLHIPAAYWWMPAPPLAWTIGLYALAAVGLAGWARKPSKRLAAWLFPCWVILTLAPPLLLSPRGWSGKSEHVVCTFAAVGHGTSVLVELPDGRTLLYDAGHQGTPYSAARSISALLWSRGIWHLDAIIISHADVDHYNAVPQLLDRFWVDRIYVPPRLFLAEGTALRALETTIRSRGVPVVEVAAGCRLWADEHSAVTVLHPSRVGVAGSDNANSLVVALARRGRTLLLPGDLEPPGLQALLTSQPLDCDLAMAPHHGSRRSDPAAFAAWAKPDWVVISGGAWRDTTEVRRIFARGAAHVLHTAETGAVRVTCDVQGMRVRCWRDDPW